MFPSPAHCRVDAIIQLPLPNAEERLAFAVQSCAELLIEFLECDEKASLQAMMSDSISEMMTSSLSERGLALRSISLAGVCEISPHTSRLDSGHLNLKSCMFKLVAKTEMWSLRDIA